MNRIALSLIAFVFHLPLPVLAYTSECPDNWLMFSSHRIELDKTTYNFTRYKGLVRTTTTLGDSDIFLISTKNVVFVKGLPLDKAKQLEPLLRSMPVLMTPALSALKRAFPEGPCSISRSRLFEVNLDDFENSLGMNTNSKYSGKVTSTRNGIIEYELSITSSSMTPNKGLNIGTRQIIKGEISYIEKTYNSELHTDTNGYIALRRSGPPIIIDTAGLGSADINDVLRMLREQ